jgi:hypothetical protein
MNRPKPRLTYANVVATLALLIAVAGSSAFAASQLGKNTVGSKQLRRNAVTTAKVKKEAITAAKIKRGTLTGAQINVTKLGTVPSAQNAQSLGGLSADQIEQASKLLCPAGTEPVAGVCFESTLREPAGLSEALITCAHANRRLPSEGELIAFGIQHYETEGKSEWVEPMYVSEEQVGIAIKASKNSVGFSLTQMYTLPTPYRCVTGPSN